MLKQVRGRIDGDRPDAHKREVGDWDEAEQEALAAMERAEPAPVG